MKIIVTGGAGFIGSCIIRMLNDKGINDIIVVDDIGTTEKWRNLVNKSYLEYIHKDRFFERIDDFKDVEYIIHMGACSSTTEKDFDYLYTNNFEYTKKLWEFCADNNIKFIYASSAATYGDGKKGFSDEMDINELRPLNGYGYSKHFFDLWVLRQDKFPKQYVGLKFFNVYGPNEYHKGSMASVILHSYKQIKENGTMNLFKSYNPNYDDGEQMRDFIYVKDICSVIEFFMSNSNISGLYNIGTGNAESFNTLGHSIFDALNINMNIKYVDMPEHLKGKYQYFTEASMNKLRNVGYDKKFYTLKEGVSDYVINYLENEFGIY